MKTLKGNGWSSSNVVNGSREIHCTSWSSFLYFIDEQLINYDSYVFRGHASTDWKLEPTIDRALADPKSRKSESTRRTEHLEKFKHATRGRRGSNPKDSMSENDWWALGQHHGLLTPLLDWSESPFVAAYFAFLPESDFDSQVVVYGLSRKSCERKNKELKQIADEDKAQFIEFIRPLTDENPRLINQRGLFTKIPEHTTVEEWVSKNYKDPQQNGACLLKIFIPAVDRLNALKSLNRMNINHLSLFPDLDGASKHCNTSFVIPHYG